MNKEDKIGFKEVQKNAARQRILDAVMEHIYFAAIYEGSSRLTFMVNEKDKEGLCESLRLYGFKVEVIPIDSGGLFENAAKLLISW